MIADGLPLNREQWPEGLLDQLCCWEQGDVVAEPPFFYFADPSVPILNPTRQYTDSSTGPEVVLPELNLPIPFGLVTTQTCDIGEEASSIPLRPWVQLAPVYELKQKGWKKSVLSGRGPLFFLRLPLLGTQDEVWVADLRIELPIEKGWLGGRERISAFPDGIAKQIVGKRLARIRARPAFSRELNSSVHDPILTLMEEPADGEEDPGKAQEFAQVIEIAVRANDLLAPRWVQIVVLTSAIPTTELRRQLEDWWDEVLGDTGVAGIELHALDVRSVDDVTAREYRQMTVVWSRN